MGITISDCLKLNALKDASLLAGKNGLNRIVDGVSVLEYANPSVLKKDFFNGNELIITAFISIKDDIEQQCKVIEKLSEAGESGIIIYYVGVFLKGIDKRLLDKAEECDFPLICMPEGKFNLRYSEVINQVYECIFVNQVRNSYFVSDILERISQLNESQINVDRVLKMLSYKLQCSFFLLSQLGERIGQSIWQDENSFSSRDILESIHDNIGNIKNNEFNILVNDVVFNVFKMSISLEDHNTSHFFAVFFPDELKRDDFKQAAEVVQLFLNIWKYDIRSENKDALVRPILRSEMERIKYISKLVNFDTSSINTIWIFKDTEKNLSANEIDSNNFKRAAFTKLFMEEHGKLALINIHDNNLIVLMNCSYNNESDIYLEEEFVKKFKERDSNSILVIFHDIDSIVNIKEAYLFSESIFDKARLIYPRSRIIKEYELAFSKNCIDAIFRGDESVRKSLNILKPLTLYDDYDELMATLEIFLLDAQKSFDATGEIMFLHKNTVKYRINKIKKRLGYDIDRLPESYEIYRAVAINRIIKNNY